ncbi:glycosyltransferase family 39 protein [Phytomonospora sp. NPDC050363]|uniref:dolichyl-phosphate-mannose--protein mannosyltransferase n=1 Tax=Phytomonospora sp. NPDC050363 TaxID=3155642 RepID=UPI0033D218C1
MTAIAEREDAAVSVPSVAPDVRDRLAPPAPDDRLRGWIVTGAVVAIAAVLRLVGLVHPRGMIFDEVYYAQDAWDLLHHGVEWEDRNNTGAFVAHPPLGKWCIALGEWLFGFNEFGWRISAVVASLISVLLIVRIARRLFGSTVLAGVAGLLMALDGMAFVTGRTALLDVFLMVFVLAGFYFLIRDREQRRRRWLSALDNGLDPKRRRPGFAVPWWRLAAAVMLGCALGVKWSAVWYIAAFMLLIFVWEWRARRSVGVPHAFRDTLIDELGWLFAFGMIVALVYLATWTGWFVTDDGWGRHWAAEHGQSEPPVWGALSNLIKYHQEVLEFHEGLSSPHTYQSWPWQWLLDARPVAYYWSTEVDCGAGSCAAEVLLLGTPLLWWSFIPALVAIIVWGLAKRDWRSWALLVAVAAGFLPWLNYPDRTMFYFYALPAEPFLILAVVFALGMIGGYSRTSTVERRLTGAFIVAGYVTVIALCFAYFYPIYTGMAIPYDEWYARMWLDKLWI